MMSNMFSKLVDLIKFKANKIGNAVIDANAIEILEQQILNAENELKEAKSSLTEIVATIMQNSKKVNELADSIAKHEKMAIKALEKNENTLAEEIANKISELEKESGEYQAIVAKLKGEKALLERNINENHKEIEGLKRQHQIIKTTESVNKVTASVKGSYGNSRLSQARQSLERIKAKQEKHQYMVEASSQVENITGEGALDSKLREAGIMERPDRAEEILERLKSKASN